MIPAWIDSLLARLSVLLRFSASSEMGGRCLFGGEAFDRESEIQRYRQRMRQERI